MKIAKITLSFVLLCFMTRSWGLRCRQCSTEGTEGLCGSFSDNGIEKECEGFNACIFSEANIAGFEQIQRACGFSPDGQNGCQTQEVAGVQVEYCYCTSDNCNQDNQCSCSSGSSSSKMKCQHCGTLESGYKCDSPDDQGESKECLAPGMVCFYHKYDNGDTYRGCTIESGPEVCFEDEDSKKCQCQSENCNIDEECYPQSRCDF